MDETPVNQTGNNNSDDKGVSNGAESVEEVEKKDWLEEAIAYEATPDRLRDPKLTQDFIKSLNVPRSTYYRTISLPENQKRILDICFKQAKKRTPNILDKMGQKAEEGNDKSQEMFMDYVLELKKKLALVGGDKDDNPIEVKWKS